MDKVTLLEELKLFKRRISEKLGACEMILFGSRAEGKIHEASDVDLIIVSPQFVGVKLFKRAVGLYDYWTIDLPVDFLCFTPEEFEARKKGVTIVSHALKTGIVI